MQMLIISITFYCCIKKCMKMCWLYFSVQGNIPLESFSFFNFQAEEWLELNDLYLLMSVISTVFVDCFLALASFAPLFLFKPAYFLKKYRLIRNKVTIALTTFSQLYVYGTCWFPWKPKFRPDLPQNLIQATPPPSNDNTREIWSRLTDWLWRYSC